MTITDRIRTRTVRNQVKRIDEILEAMQCDSHGLENGPLKQEVDDLWRRVFEQPNRMRPEPQDRWLELIREPWTNHITHPMVTSHA